MTPTQMLLTVNEAIKPLGCRAEPGRWVNDIIVIDSEGPVFTFQMYGTEDAYIMMRTRRRVTNYDPDSLRRLFAKHVARGRARREYQKNENARREAEDAAKVAFVEQCRQKFTSDAVRRINVTGFALAEDGTTDSRIAYTTNGRPFSAQFNVSSSEEAARIVLHLDALFTV